MQINSYISLLVEGKNPIFKNVDFFSEIICETEIVRIRSVRECIKLLLFKHENWRLDPQHPLKNQADVKACI